MKKKKEEDENKIRTKKTTEGVIHLLSTNITTTI